MDVMSEPRRLHFTTVGPMGKEKKKKSSSPPTLRFTLALRESNDKTCPEFWYADLMKNALGDCKNAEPGDFDIEDHNENERLVALARSFEERYGPKHSKTQSKRCDAIQDLVDLGDGYDETDPFVDNSEAYDELVPACLTTKLGGFYINSGVLDFRDVSDDSSDDFVNSPIKKKKKSKRVIVSDTESDGEMKKKIPKIKKLKDGINKERRKKSSGDKEFKKPRKPANKDLLRKKSSSSTVKELLKQQNVTHPATPIIPTTTTTTTTPVSLPTPTTSPTAPATPKPSPPNPPSLTPPPINNTITTTTTAMTAGSTPIITTTISITTTTTTSASTSNNNGHASDPNVNSATTTITAGLLSQDRSSSSSSGYMGTVTAVTHIPISAAENDAIKMESGLTGSQPFNNVKEDSNSREAYKPLDPESIPKLCEGIPDPLEKTITQLKQAAKHSVEGKCKFFTTDVNKMLLEIETESRLLNSSQRSCIYAHLAAFLPCSKDTLLKRAKKLILTQQDDKLKEPTQRLRDAINEEMPAQLEKYKNEYHGTSLGNPNPNADNTEMKEEGSSESDEDKSTEGDKNEKKCLIIKKTFEWNDKIRSLLCDIVKLKLESYGMSKLRAQSAEEYLKSFLKMEVKPLWPKGWMHVRLLFKESRSVHNKMTLYKTKKVPLINKPQLSISVGNVPNPNSKDPSPHSNNSLTNVHIDPTSGLQTAKADVSPILSALTNEMIDESPTASEKVSENENLWNLLEYTDSHQHQSQTFSESSTVTSTPMAQVPLYFSHTSPDGALKGERQSPIESIKETTTTSVSNTPMYHHGLLSAPSLNPVSMLSTQTTSPQISPSLPSVKASYSQISPISTPTSTKQGISSLNTGKTSLHSQAEFSSNKTISNICEAEQQHLSPQTISGVAATLLAMHSPQQASPTGITVSDAMSQNYQSYLHKDSGPSVKSDPKHNQHNGQPVSSTSPSTPKSLILPSQVSTTYQNIKQKDSSPHMQNKPATGPQIQNVMAKTVGTKTDSSIQFVNPDKPQNAGNMSPPPGQFSPKDDPTHTYLAEYQRYAASCLKTPLGSQKVKMQHPIASTTVTLATAPVSKGIDVKPLPQQARSPYQLAAQHHLGKVDVPSLGQQSSQHGAHQSLPQQQQQKPMISQNIHPSNHPSKSHPSSHSPHQQHSKAWRPPASPQQSSQQQNRHQPTQQQQTPPQKSYSSPHMSVKPMSSSSSSISQVVNYQAPQQQQQLNLPKQQMHVKGQQVQQQPRTTLSLQHQVKVDNVLKHHSTTPSTVQTVSSLTATRQPHHTPTSVMNTNNKMITGVTSSSTRGSSIHSLLSGSSNLSMQPTISSLKSQNRSHCLESASTVSPSVTTSATSASLGSASSGSVYKLPTISNITSSVGSTSHQHLSSTSSPSYSKLTSHTVTTLPQHQGMVRSQGSAGLQLRAGLPSKNCGVGYTAVSASQGKSSAQTWNLGNNISSATGTTLSSSEISHFSSALYPQQQLQPGSTTRLTTTTSQNYSARNLPGMQSSLSGSFPPGQLNQESVRHSKSE